MYKNFSGVKGLTWKVGATHTRTLRVGATHTRTQSIVFFITCILALFDNRVNLPLCYSTGGA